MIDWLVYIVAGILSFWLTGLFFTGVVQDFFIFRPKKLKVSHKYEFEQPFEELFLKTSPSTILNALWFKDTLLSEKGIVLYYHGNSSNLSKWGFVSEYFCEKGYDVFLYDYPGFGKSKGKRSQEAFYNDAMEMYKYISGFYPAKKIIVYGRSMGTAMASYVAAHKPAKQLVLATPFSSMRDLFYSYYPFLPRIFFFKYRFPNKDWVKKVPYPVLVLHGTRDRVVPYRCGARLKQALKPEDEFITVEDGSHNNLSDFPDYHEALDRLFDG